MIDVVDAVLNLLEAGGAVDPKTSLRKATSGIVVDHTAERPPQTAFSKGYLYCYPVQDDHRAPDLGKREDFVIEALYIADRADEEAQLTARREVSVELDTKAHAYSDVIDANRTRAAARPWDYLTLASINWDRLRSFNVRGVALRITGWRYADG